MEEYMRVVANINLDAIEHNVQYMKKKLPPNTRLMVVLKTDGYGHGAVVIATELEKEKLVYGFAIATVEEAILLRKAGICSPILILGYAFPYSFESIVEYDLIPTMFQIEFLKQLSDVAQKLQKEVTVHIKVDTGMSRIGIRTEEEGILLVKEALDLPFTCIEGICTHFANADISDKAEALEQLTRFNNFVEKIEQECNMTFPIKHCSNSAAILELSEANLDMVRAGIILYGLWPSSEIKREGVSLKPALELKSHIIYIKEVEKGVPISYNGIFVTNRNTLVATIPVGYGDGYPRSLSNIGYVLIRGEKCPILGRVCMDQMMVDVTHVLNVCEMDEVTLIGGDGDAFLSAEEVGDMAGRFNYELVCALGKRIPRAYFKKGKLVASKDYYKDCDYLRFE